MKRKMIIAVAAVLVLAVFALVLMRRSRTADGSLKLTGTIETTTVELSFKVPGRLKERLVDEGQQVVKGQIIARLEDDELKEENNARVAEQHAAESALADLKAGSRKEEILAAEATLARIKADAVRAASDAERAEGLFRKEVIPRKDLDAARAAKDGTAAAVREAEERVKLARIGARPDAIKQAKARMESAGAVRSLSSIRLAQAVLTTPLSGTVLAKHAETGELLAAGSPVITVAALDDVWVRAYIPETELGRVKLGQAVRVTTDTWKGRIYQGTVSFIASETEFTPRNVQTEAERVKLVYRIKISIKNPEQELKPGMPVDAFIDSASNSKGNGGI